MELENKTNNSTLDIFGNITPEEMAELNKTKISKIKAVGKRIYFGGGNKGFFCIIYDWGNGFNDLTVAFNPNCDCIHSVYVGLVKLSKELKIPFMEIIHDLYRIQNIENTAKWLWDNSTHWGKCYDSKIPENYFDVKNPGYNLWNCKQAKEYQEIDEDGNIIGCCFGSIGVNDWKIKTIPRHDLIIIGNHLSLDPELVLR